MSVGAAVVHDENALPNRPPTAFSASPVCIVLMCNVYSAPAMGKLLSPSTELNVKNNFCSVLKVAGTPYALQDVCRPLTYLQIFDASNELLDPAIIQRLSHYCDVIHCHRNFFIEPGWEHVHNRVRHYRIRHKSSIPRFDRYYVQFHYVGQPRTCHLCGQTISLQLVTPLFASIVKKQTP